MKKSDVKITVYQRKKGFFVEVSEFENDIEFWIYHQNYGIKDFMFGIDKAYIDEQNTIEDLINRNFTEYKKHYIQEYMQEE